NVPRHIYAKRPERRRQQGKLLYKSKVPKKADDDCCASESLKTLGLAETTSTFYASGSNPCSKLVFPVLAGTAPQFPSHSQNRLLCASFWGYHTNYSSAWITPPLVYRIERAIDRKSVV